LWSRPSSVILEDQRGRAVDLQEREALDRHCERDKRHFLRDWLFRQLPRPLDDEQEEAYLFSLRAAQAEQLVALVDLYPQLRLNLHWIVRRHCADGQVGQGEEGAQCRQDGRGTAGLY